MLTGTQRIRSQPWAIDIQNHPPDTGSAVSDLGGCRHHCWSGQHQREGDCGACWERWVHLEFNGKTTVIYSQMPLFMHLQSVQCTKDINIGSQNRQFDAFWAEINVWAFLSVILVYLLSDYTRIVQLADKAEDLRECRVTLSAMLFFSACFLSFSADGWRYHLPFIMWRGVKATKWERDGRQWPGQYARQWRGPFNQYFLGQKTRERSYKWVCSLLFNS